MADRIRIVIAQIDLLVGEVRGNYRAILAACAEARDNLDADIVVFPELAISGYPPEDLLLRATFVRAAEQAVRELAESVTDVVVILGYPHAEGENLYNAAAVIQKGRIVAIYHKHHLPNYGVFDEKRYFTAGDQPCVVTVKGLKLGITICEDLWQAGPLQESTDAGAQLIININASPFHLGKGKERMAMLKRRVNEIGVPIVYANIVGGQDELIFDGESLVVDGQGALVQRAPAFEEGLFPVDALVNKGVELLPGPCTQSLADEPSVYSALVLGVRDYVRKNRFSGVVIGLSGGVDSALTLAIAADAVGAENVRAVLMPSRYTAQMSIEDATTLCRTLGVGYDVISIEPPLTAFLSSLEGIFAGLAPDATEENIQARCRGVILMAISNKTGKLVLTTGNKSELAVGYATLYGDMAGGFAPLKDVPKTMVYRLAGYRNSIKPVIPQRILTRAPSAELAPDQKDEDTLPPYPVLDPILEMYIDQNKSIGEIVAAGYDRAIVTRVTRMVDRNEYKRRQAPPGIKVTGRAFGRDRRYPITAGDYERDQGQ